MKLALGLLLLGVGALMVQGAAALVVPARFLPDVGLLLVVAFAICVRSTAAGIALAAVFGYVTDLLSGALLGQHMLMRMAAYAAARFGGSRLNLRGPLPQAVFVVILSVGHALALWALVAFFSGDLGSPLVTARELVPHALVNGFFAPFVSEVVGRLVARLGEDESQRPLRLEPRSFST